MLGNITESDENHLAWAWKNQRVVISHDVNTLTKAATHRFEDEKPVFGLIIVPQSMSIGDAIEELELIIICSTESELENRIRHLPVGLL